MGKTKFTSHSLTIREDIAERRLMHNDSSKDSARSVFMLRIDSTTQFQASALRRAALTAFRQNMALVSRI